MNKPIKPIEPQQFYPNTYETGRFGIELDDTLPVYSISLSELLKKLTYTSAGVKLTQDEMDGTTIHFGVSNQYDEDITTNTLITYAFKTFYYPNENYERQMRAYKKSLADYDVEMANYEQRQTKQKLIQEEVDVEWALAVLKRYQEKTGQKLLVE